MSVNPDASNIQVLGSGGFGVVIVNPHNSNEAIKFFKSIVHCNKAKNEYIAHQCIYAKYIELLKKMPGLKEKIFIPGPKGFKFYNENKNKNEMKYKCNYTMERIISSRSDGVAQHIGLNDYIRGQCGKIWFTTDIIKENNKVGRSIPAKEVLDATLFKFGPRGEFIWVDDIQVNPDYACDIAYHVGVLYQIVHETKSFSPKDVEIVLDDRNRVCMLDFGMVGEKYSELDEEIDMYVPDKEANPEWYARFIQGKDKVKDIFAQHIGGAKRGKMVDIKQCINTKDLQSMLSRR